MSLRVGETVPKVDRTWETLVFAHLSSPIVFEVVTSVSKKVLTQIVMSPKLAQELTSLT